MRRLALVLPLLLVLPACSSGGGSSVEDQRAEYISAAEQICSDANVEIEALGEPTSIDTVADFAEDVVAVLEGTAEDLTALEPPEDDSAELTEKVLDPINADVGTAQDYAAEVRTAADAGDSAALLALVSELPMTTADVEFMREYGLTECADATDTGA